MADDWQIGDLALCVDDEGLFRRLVRKGAIYSVAGMRNGVHANFGPVLALYFHGINDAFGHAAVRFRKIRPLTDEEREDFEEDLRVPGHDQLPHTPQAPAREVVSLPALPNTHHPLGGAGLSADFNHFDHGSEVV